MQPKAKQALQDIWAGESQAPAKHAFNLVLKAYEPKYPKATAGLEKDRNELLTFFEFPAQHWQSRRTTNPIELTFGTIRHRTKQTNGCLTRDGLLHMMYKLGQWAKRTWHRLCGFQQLPEVMEGIQFIDGIETTTSNPVAA